MRPLDSAPKDGTRIKLYRRNGDIHIGRWAKKLSLFRSGKQWLNDDDKFLDTPINPVIGWNDIGKDGELE